MPLAPLASSRFDLLVIGAGIHGAFAAWDAARRGLRVALIDRGDFGGAASANSLKIVHGGFRYLQRGDLARLRASSGERSALLRMASHLVAPLPCVIPTRGWGMRGPLALGAALAAYELLTLDRNGAPRGGGRLVARGRLLDRAEYERLAAPLAVAGARGGALWYDALLASPDRLLIAVVRSAACEGAVVANYVDATRLLRESDGGRARIVGARVRDERGEEADVRARVTLVAAGAGARSLRVRDDGAGLPAFARACNVVLARAAPAAAAAIPVRGAARYLFAVPWRGRLMLGTTQRACAGDAAEATTDRQVDELLAAVNDALPGLALGAGDVRLVHSGLLPGTPEALLDRPVLVDHEARDAIAGVVTMLGVKWTTARRTAAHGVDLCARHLGVTHGAAPATLVGSEYESLEALRRDAAVPPAPLSPATGAHLTAVHGARWRDVASIAAAEPALAAPLARGVETIGAEIVHAVRVEMARHLSDIVLRRTELGSAGHPGDEALAAAARLAARELGWDAARTSAEVAAVEGAYPGR